VSNRFRDFDAFWASRNAKPIRFKAFGKVYTLPSEMPASFALKMVRLQQEGKADKPTEPADVLEMAEILLGKKTFHELIEKGMGINQFVDLITWVINVYAGEEQAEAEDEDPQ